MKDIRYFETCPLEELVKEYDLKKKEVTSMKLSDNLGATLEDIASLGQILETRLEAEGTNNKKE